MDRVTEVTKDCFDALLQLRAADEATLPAPEVLHARLREFVDELQRRALDHGFGREEARDIAYAVVALADEVVLSKPSEALRSYWSLGPLQLHYFQENVAGEAFFTRLDALRGDPRRADVLRVYYLALLMGFQGRYRVRGGELELMGIIEALGRDVLRGREHDAAALSPHGDRPEEGVRLARSGRPLLWVVAGAIGVSLALYLTLRISLAATAGGVVDRIAQAAAP